LNKQVVILSDAELINGCINKDRKHQWLLYQKYAPVLLSVTMRYAVDKPQAEDMLQETFIKVFKNIQSFRNEGSFEGWMRRIAVHTSIEWLRKHQFISQMAEIETTPLSHFQEEAFHKLSADDLLRMIQDLAPGYRTVFNLYAIEGYSHREISEMLQISEGTSKSQFARARYLLEKRIANSQKVNYAAAVL
jgi:RNA polymerase sigma-70 factor (ECF subfamily)